MMKRRWSVWLNFLWLSKRLWNVNRVFDECWNNEENVNVLKWPIWGGYIIVLWWILNRIWDIDWAADEWLYEYYKGSIVLYYWM
jgi:hypothetical protein